MEAMMQDFIKNFDLKKIQKVSLLSVAIMFSLASFAYADDVEKGYILTKVDAKGENTITKFEYNEETKTITPVYYRLDLAKTEYGSGDGVKYYEWKKYGNSYSLEEVATPTPDTITITARYDNSNPLGKITEDQNGADVTGNFIGSYGVIYNRINCTIGDINVNFIRNSSPVDNYGTIGNFTGDFIGNGTGYPGGAIANYDYGTIGNITGNFIDNNAQDSGGAIYNRSTIGDITGSFIVNHAYSGGAIYNDSGTIGNITGDFIGNSANGNSGGTITNYGTIGDITGDFIGNSASYYGGAIDNEGTVGKEDGGFINSSFINNYAEATSGNALGGAIYTTKNINIIADNGKSIFSGNYTKDSSGEVPNAIYVDNSTATVKLNSKNNGLILFDDQIDGIADGYNLYLTGDSTSKIVLNNSVNNSITELDNVNLYLTKNDIFQNSKSFTANSGMLSFINGVAENQIIPNMTINGPVSMQVDVDLQNELMDRLPDDVTVAEGAKINVSHLNLLNDAEKILQISNLRILHILQM